MWQLWPDSYRSKIFGGGRLQNQDQLLVMESVSLVVNLIAMLLVAMRAGYIGQFQNVLFVRVGLWVFFGLFALNTLGNLLAVTLFEKSMAEVTLFLAFGFFQLARRPK